MEDATVFGVFMVIVTFVIISLIEKEKHQFIIWIIIMIAFFLGMYLAKKNMHF